MIRGPHSSAVFEILMSPMEFLHPFMLMVCYYFSYKMARHLSGHERSLLKKPTPREIDRLTDDGLWKLTFWGFAWFAVMLPGYVDTDVTQEGILTITLMFIFLYSRLSFISDLFIEIDDKYINPITNKFHFIMEICAILCLIILAFWLGCMLIAIIIDLYY